MARSVARGWRGGGRAKLADTGPQACDRDFVKLVARKRALLATPPPPPPVFQVTEGCGAPMGISPARSGCQAAVHSLSSEFAVRVAVHSLPHWWDSIAPHSSITTSGVHAANNGRVTPPVLPGHSQR